MPTLIVFIIFACLSSQSFAQEADNKSPAPQEQVSNEASPEPNPSKETSANNSEDSDNRIALAQNKTLQQFKGYDSEGKEILCSKDQAEQQTIDGKTVYRCRSKNEALGEDSKSERGEGETNELIDNLLEQSKQAPKQRIELNQQQVEQIKEIKEENLQQEKSGEASPEKPEENPEEKN